MRDSEIMVSICMITYNHEKYIRQAIESILSQVTNFNFELLIHDDASPDNTGNIIREYAEKYPDLIHAVIQTENKFSKGIKITNTYLQPMIKGKYFAICEGDDYWTDIYKLQKQVDYLERHPEIPAVGSRYYIVDKEGSVIGISHEGETTDRMFTKNDALRLGAGILHPNTLMMRTEVRKCEHYNQGVEKCCIMGTHTFMIYYLTALGPIYIFEDIMGAWRKVIETDGTSYASRSKKHSITYSVKLLEMYIRYQNFFGNQFDFSEQICAKMFQAFKQICFFHEEGASKIQEFKKVLKLLKVKDYIFFAKWMTKKVLNKIKHK